SPVAYDEGVALVATLHVGQQGGDGRVHPGLEVGEGLPPTHAHRLAATEGFDLLRKALRYLRPRQPLPGPHVDLTPARIELGVGPKGSDRLTRTGQIGAHDPIEEHVPYPGRP